METAPDTDPLARVLKALADENRLRAVALLAHGELCVCHLEVALGTSQPTVSRAMSILRHAGVVAARREGTWVHYRLIVPAHEGAARVLAAVVEGFVRDPALAAEAARVRRTKGPPCPEESP